MADAHEPAWAPHERDGFVPVRVLDRSDAENTLVEPETGGAAYRVAAAELQPRLAGDSGDMPDLVRLESLSEASILHALAQRFRKDAIYTNIGDILISVNPFKWEIRGLYDDALMQRYCAAQETPAEGEEPVELPPHIFAVAAAALAGIREHGAPQAVVISGESGAGKTEATKKCLHYLAEVAGSQSGVERKILAANPLLEAFGNAKTLRNNNSSRFGKWIEVLCDSDGIRGCRTVEYLLEKSRVVAAARDERSYHVFYQLCAHADAERFAELRLRDADHFAQLHQTGCVAIGGVDDAAELETTLAAMDALRLPAATQDDVFRCVAAVLHLGDVGFRALLDAGDDGCEVAPTTREELSVAARLLGVEPDVLGDALCHRTFAVHGEVTRVDLSEQQASDSRHALSKALYGRLFAWLVRHVNEATSSPPVAGSTTVGILDIFGFEIFEENSFEQLCINYANERLQHHFNDHVFRSEEECYRSEGLAIAPTNFVDNQDVLDLIDGRQDGLLRLLDEQISVPRGSDDKFLSKATRSHAAHPRFAVDVHLARTQFRVTHYAGAVVYDAQGFLEKNKDALHAHLQELLRGSGRAFVAGLFPETAPTTSSKTKRSLGSEFHTQLDALMATLGAARPHFVRCLKPNAEKRAGVLDGALTLEQLRYAGVMEAIKIRKAGFPFRRTHRAFLRRYAALGGSLEAVVAGTPDVHVGRTLVLYRPEAHRALEARLRARQAAATRALQRAARGFLGRQRFHRLLHVLHQLQAALAMGDDLLAAETALRRADEAGFEAPAERACRALQAKLAAQARVRGELEALARQDPWTHRRELLAALREADDLELTGACVAAAHHTLDAVRERATAEQSVLDGIEHGDAELIAEGLQHIDRLHAEFGDFVEPGLHERADAALARLHQEERLCGDVERALEAGQAQPRGPEPGELDLSLFDLPSLQTALEALRAFPPCSDAARALLVTGEVVLQWRRWAAAGDWATIAAQDPHGEADCPELMREARHQVALALLVGALAAGAVGGAPGALDLAEADATGLQGAVRRARKLGLETQRTQRLCAAAALLAELRRAALAADWPAAGVRAQAAEAAGDVAAAPPEAAAELRLIVAETHDRAVAASVEELLAAGAAGGSPDQLDLGAIEFAKLAALLRQIERRQADVVLGARTQRLLAGARVVVASRRAIAHAHWAELERLLAEAAAAGADAEVADELGLYRLHVAHRGLCQGLVAACLEGRLVGSPGHARHEAVDVARLEALLNQARALPYRGGEELAAHVALAQAVRNMRSALLQHDWEHAAELAAACDGVASPHAGAVGAETELVRGECLYRRAYDRLHDALAIGGLSGPVGRVNPAALRTEHLSNAIAAAAELHCDVVAISQLVDLTKIVRTVREALLAGDMPLAGQRCAELAAHMAVLPAESDARDAVEQEAARAQLEVDNAALVRGLEAALAEGGVGGEPGAIDLSAVRVDLLHAELARADALAELGEDAQRLVDCARALLGVRTALRHGDWSDAALGDASLDAAALDPVRPEVELTRRERDNRAVVTRLRAAVAARQTDDEEYDGGVADVAAALALAAERGCHTDAARALRATAQVLLAARTAKRDGDWEAMARALDEPDVLPEAEAEVEALSLQLDNHQVVSAIQAGWRNGCVRGRVGALDTSGVSLDGLRRGIEIAECAPPLPVRTQALVGTARLVLQMRAHVLDGDWDAIEQTLVDLRDCLEPEAPEAKAELQLLRDEAANVAVVNDLELALISGAPSRRGDELVLDDVDVREVQHVLVASRALPRMSDDARTLVRTGMLVVALRKALLLGEWADIEESLALADFAVADVSEAEVDFFRAELDNHRVERALALALTTGMAAGELGDKDASALSVQPLEDAIALAREVHGDLAPQTRVLDATVRLVRQLRLAWADGDWDAVQLVVDQVRGAEVTQTMGSLALPAHALYRLDAIEAEVAAAEAELANRDVVQRFRSAMRRPQGAKRSNRDKLAVAVAACDRLAVSSSRVRRLRQSADWLARLPPLIDAGAWDEAVAVVDAVEGESEGGGGGGEPECATELAELANLVRNRQLGAALRAAVASGRAPGALGAVEHFLAETADLEAALELAARVDPLAPQNEPLLCIGEALLNARVVLKAGSWDALAPALATLRQVVAENTVCDVAGTVYEELELLEGEVREREVVESLQTHDHDLLEAAVQAARAAGCRTERAQRLLERCTLLCKMRAARAREDHEGVLRLLGAMAGGPSSAEEEEAQAEAQAGVAVRDAADALAALQAAPMSGLGLGDAVRRSLRELEPVLDALPREHTDANVVATCEAVGSVFRLREALAQGDWPGLAALLRALGDSGASVAVRDEVAALRKQTPLRRACLALEDALRKGGPVLLGSRLDLEALRVQHLPPFVREARTQLGVVEEDPDCAALVCDAKGLLAAAAELADLRLALKGDLVDGSSPLLHSPALQAVAVARAEVGAVLEGLELRERVDAVVAHVREGVERTDEDMLVEALAEAEAVELQNHPNLMVVELVLRAQSVLEQVRESSARLAAATAACDVRRLQAAVAFADSFGHVHARVRAARTLAARLIRIQAEADRAAAEYDVPAMGAALAEAREVGFALPTARELERLIGLEPQALLQLRLRAALDRGDEPCVVAVTVELKRLFFESRGEREFAPAAFPGLRVGLGEELRWTDAGLDTSLTRLPEAEAYAATQLFSKLQGAMGDRAYSYPDALVVEILDIAESMPALRTELFLQLCAQLTDNPGEESAAAGWQLMLQLLQEYSPTQALENYLEWFLRSEGQDECVAELHRGVFLRGYAPAPGRASPAPAPAAPALPPSHRSPYERAADAALLRNPSPTPPRLVIPPPPPPPVEPQPVPFEVSVRASPVPRVRVRVAERLVGPGASSSPRPRPRARRARRATESPSSPSSPMTRRAVTMILGDRPLGKSFGEQTKEDPYGFVAAAMEGIEASLGPGAASDAHTRPAWH